jgi:hypothetical protein
MVAWLNEMRLPRHVSPSNYLSSCYKTYYKASLIKVKDILILYTLLLSNLFQLLKPCCNNLRIFIFHA